MILQARYVRRGRKPYYCDWCEKHITGEHVYLYGAANATDKPSPMRLHIACLTGIEDTKIAAALAKTEVSEQED